MSRQAARQVQAKLTEARAELGDYERYSRMTVGQVYQGVEVTASKLREWGKARDRWARIVRRLEAQLQRLEGGR